MLELITISALNGVLYSMLLFLMASGLVVTFSLIGVLNFAQPSFYMLGAFLGFQISRTLGFWPAFVIAPGLVGCIGMMIESFCLRALRSRPNARGAELLFTFGLAFVVDEVVPLVWGKGPVDSRGPASLDFAAFSVFSTTYPAYKMFELLAAIAVFVALLVMLKRTRIGLIVQASLSHPRMVAMLGHNVPRVFTMMFGVGTGLAALAGVIAGPALVTQADMTAALGPILFVVVVVGGLGSLAGAFLASLLIGSLQTFAVSVDLTVGDALGHIVSPVQGGVLLDVWNVSLAQVAPIIPYLMMILILVFRPSGLMGRREQ